jgi:hypothetical protein
MRTSVLIALSLCSACEAPVQNSAANQDKSAIVGAPSKDQSEDERIEALKAGAARTRDEALAQVAAEKAGIRQEPEQGLHKWTVNSTFMACPRASDWYGVVDAGEAGDMTVNLPPRCYKISPGTKILAKDHGLRETQKYKRAEFEKGQVDGGAVFWTDELDRVTLSRLPG